MESNQKITDQIIHHLYRSNSGWADLIYFNRGPVDIRGKPLSGINTLLLNQSMYDSRIWGTQEEFLEQDKKIRPGQLPSYKASQIQGNGAYTLQKIFNLHQCDFKKENEHLTYLKWGINRQPLPFMANQVVTDYISRENVAMDIVYRSITPQYEAERDKISISNFLLFQEVDEYHLYLFMEFILSTGHPRRLNRPGFGKASFEPDAVSQERLISELGAYLLAAETAVRPDVLNSLSNVRMWIPFLMEDPSRIIKAFYEAEKAVQFILRGGSA